MKPIKSLTNTDKSKLLHELFPNEIPLLLDNILEVCTHLKEHKEAYAQIWDFGLFTFDMWLSLAEQAEQRIQKYRPSMIKSSKVFSEQLFGSFDYTVLFVNNRVCKYGEKAEDPKFKKAVDLLFNQ